MSPINFDPSTKAADVVPMRSSLTGDRLTALMDHTFTITGIDVREMEVKGGKGEKENVLYLTMFSNRRPDMTVEWKATPPSCRFLNDIIGTSLASWLGYTIKLFPRRIRCFGESHYPVYVDQVLGFDTFATYPKRGEDTKFNNQSIRAEFFRACDEAYRADGTEPPAEQDMELIRHYIGVISQMTGGEPEPLAEQKIRVLSGCLGDMYPDAEVERQAYYEEAYRSVNGGGEVVPGIDALTEQDGEGLYNKIVNQWGAVKASIIKSWKDALTDDEYAKLTVSAMGSEGDPRSIADAKLLASCDYAQELYMTELVKLEDMADEKLDEYVEAALGESDHIPADVREVRQVMKHIETVINSVSVEDADEIEF